jgi:hypothetical protein
MEKVWLTYPVSTFWAYWDLWLFESIWRSSLLNNEGMKNILDLILKDRSVKRGLAIQAVDLNTGDVVIFDENTP